MQASLCIQRVVLFSVLAAAVLQTVSCARVAAAPKSAMLPATPELAFPPALPGEKTPGCDRVLAALQALQDYTNGLRAEMERMADPGNPTVRTQCSAPRACRYQVPGVRRLRHFQAEKCQRPRRYHSVSYTHLRAHETVLDLVCRLLLEKKK